MSTPDSLWRRTAAIPAPNHPPLHGETVADVAVVGGGFTGLSAALHLAEAGASVVLVEAHAIGHGASGRNGGQVNPGLKHERASLERRFGTKAGGRFYRMGFEAPDFLAELIERKKLAAHFRQPGLIRLAHNETALRGLRGLGETLRREGVAIEDLSAADAARLVGTRSYSGGHIDPRGGSVQPLDLVRELARVAAEAGARIFCGSPATGLAGEKGAWKVSTRSGTVRAKQVIVATNGYTDGLIPGLARTLVPVNSFQVATGPLAGAAAAEILPGGHAVYDSRRLLLYFRRTPEGGVVLGGRASFVAGETNDPSRPDYDILAKALTQTFPQLAGVPIHDRWTGLVCVTPDHLPHYHRPAEGLHVVLGFNGRGVALAHRAGAFVARTALGLPETASIPPTPIRPIPFHALRLPVVKLVVAWSRLMDVFGR